MKDKLGADPSPDSRQRTDPRGKWTQPATIARLLAKGPLHVGSVAMNVRGHAVLPGLDRSQTSGRAMSGAQSASLAMGTNACDEKTALRLHQIIQFTAVINCVGQEKFTQGSSLNQGPRFSGFRDVHRCDGPTQNALILRHDLVQAVASSEAAADASSAGIP